ncbi:hypothetical protein H671_6g16519 [Cricetulus griseus]|nr:hypothetical protein H671_6g16519 [Cricetulus griseus]
MTSLATNSSPYAGARNVLQLFILPLLANSVEPLACYGLSRDAVVEALLQQPAPSPRTQTWFLQVLRVLVIGHFQLGNIGPRPEVVQLSQSLKQQLPK